MKTRRALSSSVSSTSRGGSVSDQLLPHVDLEFFDSLSDLEGFQTATIDTKHRQHHRQLFAIAGSTDEDDALKQEPQDPSPETQMPQQLKPTDHAENALLVAAAPPPRRAKFSAEVRKARHRDRMQRTRMAEKKDLEVKRGEMEQLEARLKDSISGYLRQGHEEAACNDDFFALCDGRSTSAQELALRTASLPPAVIQRKYVSLVVEQDQIKKENAQLATRILDHQKYEKLVVGELERADESMVARESNRLGELPASSATSGQSGGYWLSFTENEPHLYFEPLSWGMCQSATEATYTEMLRLQRGIANPSAAPSEGFGWRFAYGTLSDDCSRAAGDTRVRMQHQFVKRIAPHAMGTLEPITVDSIGANMWEIMNSSELYGKIYKTDMISKVLQQVDDHTSVLLRTYPNERREMRSRFLSLITRISETVVDAATGESRRRVVVLMDVLDPDACLKTGTGSSTSSSSSGQAIWLTDGVAYIAFTEIGGGQEIELEYGGYMDVASEALQPAVVRNILEALMRLERAATRSEAVLLSFS